MSDPRSLPRSDVRALLRAGLALSLVSVVVGSSDSAVAASSSVNMPVSATVGTNCTFTSTPSLSFGTYDPVVANATTALDQTATFTLVCTKGASYSIGLNAGQNGAAAGVSRSMKSGATLLGYELYSDSGRTLIWGPGSGSTGSIVSGASTGIASPITQTIYGRIPAGQDVAAGTYTDTVILTVNF